MIHSDATELIGSTPLVRLNRLVDPNRVTVAAKIEFSNPAGSVKDRVALAIINAAEKSGALGPGGTIVEATSGNTGIGLAFLAAVRGYRAVLAMPASMSAERRALLRAFGAELVLTEPSEGMAGAVAKAKELVEATPGAILASQFTNEANPAIHEATTGPEILSEAPHVDALVAGVGTGGTLTGVGRALRAANLHTRIVAVEPAASPLLSGGTAGPHPIQGIGANFVPETLDTDLIDEVLTVSGERAIEVARRAAREEGLLVGLSGGAALAATIELAEREEMTGKTIVVIIPQFGERDMSTALFEGLAEETS